MANISTLTVSLVAETAKFENGLKRSRKQASGFAKAVAGSFRIAAASTTALVGALGVLTKQSLRVVDAQQKVATRLGLSQRSLAGLTLAAEQTGNSQKNLELALQRSTRRIAEAAKGAGEAQGAIKELGLDAKELSKLSPDEQFIRLSRAFEDVTNQSDRVRLGFKLFDSEGVGLINTLRLGEEQLRAFIVESDRLGTSLDRNQTRAIEEANDATNVLTKAFSGLGNQLAVALAPSIKKAAESLTEFVISVSQGVERLSINLKDLLGVQQDLDSLTLDGLRQEYALTQNAINALRREYEDAEFLVEAASISANAAADVGDANLAKARATIRSYEEQYASLAEQLDRNIEKQKELLNPDVPDPAADGTPAAAGSITPRRALDASLADELRENLDLFAEWERRATQAFNNTRTASEALQLRLADIAEQLRINPFFDEELASREARDAVDAYIREMDRLEENSEKTFSEVSEFAKQAGANMQDAFAEFLFDPFDEGLDGMLKSFVTTLRKMIANLLAQKLLTSFFGFFPGLGQAFGFNPGTPTVPGRRIGGPVRGGQTVLGGEGSPELFTPGASGAIRPLGAVTIQQEVNFNGGGGLDPATLIPILEDNNRKLKGELLDEFDRGAFA